MTQPSWDDLDVFLSPDDFGVQAVLTPQDGGTTREVTVIYDEPYFNPQLGEYEADRTEPRANGKEADFVGVKRGDTLTISSTGKVLDILTAPQPDGTGWAVLVLAVQA
ncbi:head-tail joining protein [Terasakiella sp.]|uniref:head-tail joining protein n=1 Tax=Terasakiella sp. TaxID=2034861 RepID=UPI003AA7D5A4